MAVETRNTELQSAVDALISQNKALKQELGELRRKMSAGEETTKMMRRECVDAQIKYDSLMASKALAQNGEEAALVQQRLSRLVRKIDRCIALLNKQ